MFCYFLGPKHNMKATQIISTLIALSSIYMLVNGSLTWGKAEGNYGRNYHSPQSLQVSNQIHKNWVSGTLGAAGYPFTLSKDEKQLFYANPIASFSTSTGKVLWNVPPNSPCYGANSIDVMPGSGHLALSCMTYPTVCVAALLDQQTGKLLWKTVFYDCRGIDSTVGPNNVIYVSTQSSANSVVPNGLNITALNAEGKQIFSEPVCTISTPKDYFDLRAPLVTNDGEVLVVSDGHYWYGLSSADGSRMWKLESSSRAAIVYTNNVPTMLVIDMNYHVTAVDVQTGGVNWEKVIDVRPQCNLFISYINNTGIIHFTDVGNTEGGTLILAFDMMNGTEVWRLGYYEDPQAGAAFATDANNQIYHGYAGKVDVLSNDGQLITSVDIAKYSYEGCQLTEIIPASSNRLYVNCYSYMVALEF